MLSRIQDHFLAKFGSIFWKYRHLWDKGWATSYISKESLNHPHRKLLLDKIENYRPFRDVLEYGCASGPNLYLLSELDRSLNLEGVDISKKALKLGESFLQERGIILEHSPRKTYYDIVFTDAVCIYMPLGLCIEGTIDYMKNMCLKALILCEWHSDKGPFVKHGHWVHNYKELLPGCKITKLTEEYWPESPEWCEFGHIITYETS